MEHPFVSIIVLSYNSQPHLPTNMAALHALTYPRDAYEIILVDNASTDSTLPWLAANYPEVQAIQTGANLGFAGGNNAGVQAASGEWVVILNPDTKVHPEWLFELTRPLLHDNEIKAVASKVISWDGKTLDFGDAAINFMGWGCQPGFRSLDLHLYNEEKPLIFANGGTMLVHRQTFLELGGFDTDYFAYYEDVDLGWRLWLAGHKVWYAPKAVVYHRHHGSWSAVADAKKWLLAERNTLLTLIKNYDDGSLAHILPAALLLLFERVYLDINPDPSAFGEKVAAPKTVVYNSRYYLTQLFDLLTHLNFGELFQRTRAELRRRRNPPTNRPTNQPTNQPTNAQFHTTPIPLARLAAASDVLTLLPTMLEKRDGVQNGRKLPDQQIFDLFQWALVSNFGNDRFIHAMNRVVQRFKIDTLVAGDAPDITDETRTKSWRLSKKLLALAADILAQSDADPNWFQMERPAPPEKITVPQAQVGRLAHLHQVLWQLPDAPLDDLLNRIQNEIA